MFDLKMVSSAAVEDFFIYIHINLFKHYFIFSTLWWEDEIQKVTWEKTYSKITEPL